MKVGAGRLSAAARMPGRAALTAGLLWFAISTHQHFAHGFAGIDERDLVFGLTWMDSGKLLPVALALVTLGIAALGRRLDRPGGLARVGVAVTVTGGLGMTTGAAAEFWFFPWGSYEVAFEDSPVARFGGTVQAISSLVFTMGLIPLTIELTRRGLMPGLTAAVLILGGLTTFYLTPASWLPGLAWLALAAVLLRRPEDPVRS